MKLLQLLFLSLALLPSSLWSAEEEREKLKKESQKESKNEEDLEKELKEILKEEEEITKINVIAHLYSNSTDKTALPVEIISQEDIKNIWGFDIFSALRSIPGISMIQNGGAAGQLTRLFLRGGGSSDVLILVDGVEIKDPSTPDRAIDLSFIDFDFIERIEILKGPSSSIYGSDAMSGVINIITKKKEELNGLYIDTTTGSYNTVITKKTIAKKTPKTWYHFITRIGSSKGISALRTENQNPESIDKDGYSEKSFFLQIKRKLGSKYQAELLTHYKKRDLDLDGVSEQGIPIEDPNAEATIDYFVSKVELSADFVPRTLKTKFAFHQSIWKREYRNNPNQTDYFRSHMEKFLLTNHLNLSIYTNSIFGIDYEKETMKTTADGKQMTDYLGAFISQNFDLDPSFASFSLRYDYNSKSGEDLSYRLSLGTHMESIKTIMKLSYGKAIKRPSLFQLFSSNFGNPDLKKEQLTGIDISTKYSWTKNSSLTLNYFQYKIKDQIDFAVNKYVNTKNTKLSGIEASLFHPFLKDKINMTASHSYLIDARNELTKKRSPYKAKHMTNMGLHYYLKKNIQLNLLISHIGRRYTDKKNMNSLPSYVLLNATASFHLKKDSNLFIRLENILNKDYETVQNYSTPGISYLISWSAKL